MATVVRFPLVNGAATKVKVGLLLGELGATDSGQIAMLLEGLKCPTGDKAIGFDEVLMHVCGLGRFTDGEIKKVDAIVVENAAEANTPEVCDTIKCLDEQLKLINRGIIHDVIWGNGFGLELALSNKVLTKEYAWRFPQVANQESKPKELSLEEAFERCRLALLNRVAHNAFPVGREIFLKYLDRLWARAKEVAAEQELGDICICIPERRVSVERQVKELLAGKVGHDLSELHDVGEAKASAARMPYIAYGLSDGKALWDTSASAAVNLLRGGKCFPLTVVEGIAYVLQASPPATFKLSEEFVKEVEQAARDLGSVCDLLPAKKDRVPDLLGPKGFAPCGGDIVYVPKGVNSHFVLIFSIVNNQKTRMPCGFFDLQHLQLERHSV